MRKRTLGDYLSMCPAVRRLHELIDGSKCFCDVGVAKWKTQCTACAPLVERWVNEQQPPIDYKAILLGDGGLFKFDRLFMLVMKHQAQFIPKSLLVEHLPHLIMDHRQLNYFITGAAGTGKSHAFMQIARLLEESGKGVNYGLSAPTGSAAIRIDGVTLHALFGLKPWDHERYEKDRVGFPGKFARSLTKKDYLKDILERWKTIEVLLVDEISMVNPKLLEVIDAVARYIRKRPDNAFGGIQMVFSGDFLQLPPVPEKKGGAPVPFCFQHPIWKHVHITVLLTENRRQQGDLRLQRTLNELRLGQCSDEAEEVIRECQMRQPPTTINRVNWDVPEEVLKLPVHLFATNAQVDRYNKQCSEKNQQHPVITYRPRVKWFQFSKHHPEPKPGATTVHFDEKKLVACEPPPDTEQELAMFYTESTQQRLKPQTYRIGSLCELQVNKFKRGLSNGSLFTVVGTQPSKADGIEEVPVGWFKDQTTMAITPVRHTQWIGGTIGKFIAVDYLPMTEAFGLTIHKGQGQTYEQVSVHLEGIFAEGQAYIALSRCTTSEGMTVSGFDRSLVRANPDALKYYEQLR